MDAPPRIVAEAFRKGIAEGRNGLGSLYVFATGNGGRNFDNWYDYLLIHLMVAISMDTRIVCSLLQLAQSIGMINIQFIRRNVRRSMQ